ncbi:MAG TPA: flagellar hook-associated protein FlgL [Nevskiaceae bacterium]|nr:flagellar hook-associated protein FlgL [Nevskiaceae bacterium]
MRISTAGLHQQGVDNILKQQTVLADVQNELSTGKKIITASDNPAGAARALVLDQTAADITRWQTNVGTAQDRLGLEETALSGTNDVLTQLRSLAIQANSATQSDASRSALATQMTQLYQQLLGYANSDDGTGRYLFGGSNDAQPPFTDGASGVSYSGDQTQRLLDIGHNRAVADGDTGSAVFQNTGSGDLFATVKNLIALVQTPGGATQAQYSASLDALQTAGDHISDMRAGVGARLAMLDDATSSLAQQSTSTAKSLSDLRDVDVTDAASRLALAQTLLQAAQQSYLKVQGLSLFDYLR